MYCSIIHFNSGRTQHTVAKLPNQTGK